MANNSISLKGNLTRDPFFDYLDGRDGPVPFMRFTLAVDRHPPRQAGTDYLQVLVYGQRALHDHAYLWQGSEILVEGWIRTRARTDNSGQPATRIEVIAKEITFLRNSVLVITSYFRVGLWSYRRVCRRLAGARRTLGFPQSNRPVRLRAHGAIARGRIK